MQYNEYNYLWPPRPENAIPAAMLGFYEKRGWVGQIKKNGTCTVIFTNGEQVIFKTRHDDDHKAWSPLPEHKEFFKKIVPNNKWCVFVAELLHNKGPNIKNVLYIFDIIVYDGEQLVGKTFKQRQEVLAALLSEGVDAGDHFEITNNIWLAKLISVGFKATWDGLENPEDEGIVLKDPNALLKICLKKGTNTSWQVKCRKQHKNYSF